MDIYLENVSANNLIGPDDSGGEFFQTLGGQVQYKHPSDSKTWVVASSVDAFESAVQSLGKYNSEVSAAETEDEELICVRRFRERLVEANVPIEGSDSFWKAILDQCEWGHL